MAMQAHDWADTTMLANVLNVGECLRSPRFPAAVRPSTCGAHIVFPSPQRQCGLALEDERVSVQPSRRGRVFFVQNATYTEGAARTRHAAANVSRRIALTTSSNMKAMTTMAQTLESAAPCTGRRPPTCRPDARGGQTRGLEHEARA